MKVWYLYILRYCEFELFFFKNTAILQQIVQKGKQKNLQENPANRLFLC